MGGFTTSPPDQQDLDALDPKTGEVRSLVDLARAGQRHMEERAGGPTTPEEGRLNRLVMRYEGRMGFRLNPEDRQKVTDAIHDNPDWDIHDMLRNFGGREVAVLGTLNPDAGSTQPEPSPQDEPLDQ